VRFDIRVIPRSPRTAIEPARDGRVVIRVTAPPVDDAANEAVVALLARTFHVPRSAVRIVAGLTQRNKRVEIDGVSEDLLRPWLVR
jgi:uncharacterized protein (TIGR00251 family)